MSAALALKETSEIYGAVPEQRPSSAAGDPIEKTKAYVNEIERQLRQRKMKSIQERAQLSAGIEKLKATLNAEQMKVLLQQIDGTISLLKEQIAEHAEYVAYVEKDAKELLERVRRDSPDLFKGARKQTTRFIDVGKEMHSDAVEMYYFLISLKAEIDPEAQGGPSFDNPDDLRAHLESELAE